jgi:FtsH-binding integral membrane protein
MYWIYELPTWAMGLVVTLSFLLPALLALMAARTWIYRTFRLSDETNESVNGFVAATGVLYGLLLGLVAVATWQNYDSANTLASKEASSVAALYRDVSAFPVPERRELQAHLENYLHYVIDVAWPAHRNGEVPRGGAVILSKFQGVLAAYQPTTANQQVILAEALTAFNTLVEARRMRMDSVTTGLPSVFWVVIIAGAVLSIALTYAFHLPSLKTHLLLTGIFSLFVGFLIFLVAALDNPFRGELSVSPESYTLVLQGLLDLDPTQQIH